MNDLPLAAVHSRLGVHAAWIGDLEVPGHYGDPGAERDALRERCGLVDRSWVSRLELCGADRARFLNGLVTSDVENLEPGTGIYGFFTDLKGRVMADVWVMALEDRFWLELPSGTRDQIRAHLEKYVVADRVEVQGLEDMLPLTLVGPDALGFLEARGARLPDSVDRNALVEVSGTQMQASRRRLFGLEAVTLWVSSGVADEVFGEWVSESGGGIRPAGLEALESLRIEAGVGRWGKDYGPENLPQETGALSAAVDFEKGCYLGQEIVARVHYLGNPRRLLQSLCIEGAEELNEGAVVLADGKRVGALTSVVRSPVDTCWLALSLVERKALENGVRLELEDGREAPNRRRIKIWGRAEFVEDDTTLLERLVDSDYDARPERAFVFHVEAWDVNCPQHITPRFTQEEIEPAIHELERRNEELQQRVNELEAMDRPRTGVTTVSGPRAQGRDRK